MAEAYRAVDPHSCRSGPRYVSESVIWRSNRSSTGAPSRLTIPTMPLMAISLRRGGLRPAGPTSSSKSRFEFVRRSLVFPAQLVKHGR